MLIVEMPFSFQRSSVIIIIIIIIIIVKPPGFLSDCVIQS
jgi:hypothetical protein